MKEKLLADIIVRIGDSLVPIALEANKLGLEGHAIVKIEMEKGDETGSTMFVKFFGDEK